MKLATSDTQIQMSGGSNISQFNIEMNAKAFRVLSNTLYQDKIGSIVRELSCNAYDSHVTANKKDVPFEIHLPDSYEPWFEVKDFGVGLSEEDVYSVFTVFFKSTKDQSNNVIGAFGLGAKTPFSYTDQFIVTSVKDGIESTYSAFISDQGIPSIVKMQSCEATDKVSGVSIKMSVQSSHFTEFKNAVLEQLKFFDVKPIVTNVEISFPKEADVVLKTENVEFYADNIYYGTKIFILQGSVGYPFELNKVADKISSDNYTFISSVISSSKIRTLIRFPIGEIGVTASREGVEYDEITCRNIDNRLTIIRNEVQQFLDDQLSSCDNEWEKGILLNKNALLFTLSHNPHFKFIKKQSGSFHVDANNILIGTARLYSKSGTTRIQHTKIRCEENTVLIVRDTKLRCDLKVTEYMNANRGKNVYVYVPDEGVKVDEAFIEKLVDELGGFDNIVLVSQITLSKGNQAKYKSSVTQYYSAKNDRHISESFYKWNKHYDLIEDISVPTLYIKIEDMNFVQEGNFQTICSVIDTIHSLNFFTSVPQLIAVRTKDMKKVMKNKNLKSFSEYVESVKKSILQDKDLVRANMYQNLVNSNRALLNLTPYVTSGKLKKIVDFLNKVKDKTEVFDSKARYKLDFAKIAPKKSRAEARISEYIASNPILKLYNKEKFCVISAMSEKTVVQYALAYEQTL